MRWIRGRGKLWGIRGSEGAQDACIVIRSLNISNYDSPFWAATSHDGIVVRVMRELPIRAFQLIL